MDTFFSSGPQMGLPGFKYGVLSIISCLFPGKVFIFWFSFCLCWFLTVFVFIFSYPLPYCVCWSKTLIYITEQFNKAELLEWRSLVFVWMFRKKKCYNWNVFFLFFFFMTLMKLHCFHEEKKKIQACIVDPVLSEGANNSGVCFAVCLLNFFSFPALLGGVYA